MSKSLYTLLACSLLLPLTARADDPYLKLGVGWSRFDFDAVAENKTGFSIAYGAKYDKVWGLETGYVHFGSDSNGIFDSNGNPSTLKAQAIYLAGTGSYEMSPQAALFAKLGLAVKRYSVGGDSQTYTRWMGGIGAEWRLTKEWGASLAYDYFGKSDGLTLSQTSLSAIYHF